MKIKKFKKLIISELEAEDTKHISHMHVAIWEDCNKAYVKIYFDDLDDYDNDISYEVSGIINWENKTIRLSEEEAVLFIGQNFYHSIYYKHRDKKTFQLLKYFVNSFNAYSKKEHNKYFNMELFPDFLTGNYHIKCHMGFDIVKPTVYLKISSSIADCNYKDIKKYLLNAFVKKFKYLGVEENYIIDSEFYGFIRFKGT